MSNPTLADRGTNQKQGRVPNSVVVACALLGHVALALAAFLGLRSRDPAVRLACLGVVLAQIGMAAVFVSMLSKAGRRNIGWGLALLAGLAIVPMLIVAYDLRPRDTWFFIRQFALYALSIQLSIVFCRLVLGWTLQPRAKQDAVAPATPGEGSAVKRTTRFDLKTLLIGIAAVAAWMGVVRVLPPPPRPVNFIDFRRLPIPMIWSLAITSSCLWCTFRARRPVVGAVVLLACASVLTAVIMSLPESIYRNRQIYAARLQFAYFHIGIIAVAYPTLLLVRRLGYTLVGRSRSRRRKEAAEVSAEAVTARAG